MRGEVLQVLQKGFLEHGSANFLFAVVVNLGPAKGLSQFGPAKGLCTPIG